MIRLLIIIIGALFVANLLQAISQSQKRQKRTTKEERSTTINLSEMPYKDKYLLTKNEYHFYRELQKIAAEMNWIICPKVGLKDLFEITTKENYMSHFGRISQKHIDFIIGKDDLKPIYAIELDDNSHNTEKVKQSDNFKDELFEKSRIKLIRIKACKEYSKEYIMRNILNDHKTS